MKHEATFEFNDSELLQLPVLIAANSAGPLITPLFLSSLLFLSLSPRLNHSASSAPLALPMQPPPPPPPDGPDAAKPAAAAGAPARAPTHEVFGDAPLGLAMLALLLLQAMAAIMRPPTSC